MSTMPDVFICDAVRTPIGRYGGALAKVRTDDLAAVPIKALMSAQSEGRLGARSTRSYLGCANQAGEDNRNVARMALLLAGLPDTCPASPSTGCAPPASTRSAPPRARSAPARSSSRSRAASSR